jgi:ABC transporter substrate binding protein (PQQ-dependent alcohol dehydrogenase system)
MLCWALITIPVTSHAETELTIGYIGWKKDPRYSKSHLRKRLPLQPAGRPDVGAELAIKDSKFALLESGASLKLKDKLLRKPEQLEETLQSYLDDGIQHIVLDLPANMVARAAELASDKPALLYNVSAFDDTLRQTCQANLLHTIPSYRMLADALAQFLLDRKWTNLLVLKGTEAIDEPWNAAFLASAKRLGLRIRETRDFVLGNDPRNRSKNNISLLTKGKYDVVVVLDAMAEFAALVPFQTQNARPVVGSAGLVPLAWHWSWERHGAPQLQNRFRKLAKRDMSSIDWAAWVAVKSLVQTIQRVGTTDFDQINAFLRSDQLEVDAFKGASSSYRPWSGQLRQNLLLSDGRWVIERAPLAGFLHKTENMDTLGLSEQESNCQ